MKVEQFIGGVMMTATVGPHDGSDVRDDVVRVECELLRQPAEYALQPDDGRTTEQSCEAAIRYTIDNILVPMLAQILAEPSK